MASSLESSARKLQEKLAYIQRNCGHGVSADEECEIIGECLGLFGEVIESIPDTIGTEVYEPMNAYVAEQLDVFGLYITDKIFNAGDLFKTRFKHFVHVLKLQIMRRELRLDGNIKLEWKENELGADGEVVGGGQFLSLWTRVCAKYQDCADDKIIKIFPRHLGRHLLSYKDICLTLYQAIPVIVKEVDGAAFGRILEQMPSLRQFEGGPSGGASGGASRGASSRVKNLSAVLSWPATFKPARVYQLAITRAIANPECRRLLLKALSVDVLVSMENPVEVCLWFQEEWEHRDDLNESLWIVQRLYDCVANAELQSRAVSYDPSKVCDIVYEVFSVALFSCEDRDIILDIMERLLVVFNQKQLVYFFKKALMIAVDAPTPAAIWCITFANVILMKAPDIIIPMIHVNPTWNDLVDIRAPLCAPVSMPASLPEATSESLEQTPILETQLRTAQLCCFELQLLKHHASPAIRYAAQNLTSSLNDPTAPVKLQQALTQSKSTSSLHLLNNNVRRVMQRLALFS